ncbi:hypothetical protein FB451DRAFT_1026600, partial [Mycena latifolia]
FPLLPLELERVIFEFAALSHPRTMMTLLLVASRVKLWIEPLLYRVLIVGVQPQWQANRTLRRRLTCPAFLDVLRSKPASFVHDNVRNILFRRREISLNEAAQALSKCTGTTNLMLYSHEPSPSFLRPFSMMPLLRLSADLGRLFGEANPVDFQHAIFGRLTHLTIFDSEPEMVPSSGLARIPCLTHLSFKLIIDREFLSSILVQCPQLQVLADVIVGDHEISKQDLSHMHFSDDVRAVVIYCPDFLHDWEFGTANGADHWGRAERYIARWRTGAVKGKSRQTSDNGSLTSVIAPEFVVDF